MNPGVVFVDLLLCGEYVSLFVKTIPIFILGGTCLVLINSQKKKHPKVIYLANRLICSIV